MLLRSALSASEASEAGSSAEYVTEHGEYVIHVHSSTSKASEPAGSRRAVETELVILLAFLLVVQYIVSLRRLLEFLLGFFVAGITIRMVFYGYLSVSLFNFVL